MVKRTAPIRIIYFFLWAACGASCQSELRTADLIQGVVSISPEVRRQETRMWGSLPDTPSVQPPIRAEKLQTFVAEARSPLTLGAVGINTGVMRKTGPGHVTPRLQPSLTVLDKVVSVQRASSTFLGTYLSASLFKQNLRYHPSTRGSFMNRAAYAASHVFTTRDDSGRRRLNSSYFLGVLSSVAVHSAYRPYWMRSASAPFNDFGSTIGNDAGTNLFHEFEPGIRQTMKGHTPKFAFRIYEHITRDQNPRGVISAPAR